MRGAIRDNRPPSGVQGAPARKPRVMIAGEFSAGKTRLISGLIGEEVLPSNVTATALPPVWLVSGPKRLAAVGLDGQTRQLENLAGVNVADTHYCVVSHPAPILARMDIIDTPGSSDPSIPSESWERMLEFADMALWCTNATQAWRQSEKSVWDEMPGHLAGASTLLVTHADRMPDSRTADRVLRRVRREAKTYFEHFVMASLIRPDDIARVSEHLTQVVAGGVDCAAIENPVLERLTAQWASEASAPPEPVNMPQVTPRRIKLATADNPVTAPEPSVAEVQPEKPSAPVTGAKTSAIRLAWNELLEESDASSPASILQSVDRLISLLEKDGPLYLSAAPHGAQENPDRNARNVLTLMNGRQT